MVPATSSATHDVSDVIPTDGTKTPRPSAIAVAFRNAREDGVSLLESGARASFASASFALASSDASSSSSSSSARSSARSNCFATMKTLSTPTATRRYGTTCTAIGVSSKNVAVNPSVAAAARATSATPASAGSIR